MTSTKLDIGMEIVEGPNWAKDPDGWEHHGYTVKLSYDGREMLTPWRAGLGITDEPTLGDILESLFLDSEGWYDDFPQWAGDYGWDADSRKAESIWRAVGEQSAKVRELFGTDYNAVRKQYEEA
jgi:hypothetical protein